MILLLAQSRPYLVLNFSKRPISCAESEAPAKNNVVPPFLKADAVYSGADLNRNKLMSVFKFIF